MLVADVVEGRVEAVVRRSVVTRLGEGVDARRRLLPVPVARVRNVLTDFRQELEALGAERTLAVATSAVRDAENGEAFLGEVEWSYGFKTKLLSGEEEAQLTRRGSARREARRCCSTSAAARPSSRRAPSHEPRHRFRPPDGALRARRPADQDRAGPRRAAVGQLLPALTVTDAVGVAGTIGQLAALAKSDTLSRRAVSQLLDGLANLPLEARRRIEGLDPERAQVIVAGAIIVDEVLDHYGLAELRFSVRDLLDGAAVEAASLPPSRKAQPPPGRTRAAEERRRRHARCAARRLRRLHEADVIDRGVTTAPGLHRRGGRRDRHQLPGTPRPRADTVLPALLRY